MNARYDFDSAGNLLHFIHDELRATVAPENIPAYRESQPDAPSPADLTTTTEESHHDETQE